MEFGLVGAQAGDVEHESTDLQQVAGIVIKAEGIDQNVNWRAVLAAQSCFEVPQMAALLHDFRLLIALLGRKIELGRDIDLQQFVPRRVTQHAYHSVIDFDEAARGGAEEKAFLDVVKQFAVTALGFAPVGNVFQDMNGLRPFIRGPVDARSGNQVGA